MGILSALDGKTLLIIFHFIGLAFGAGGAWISDLIIIRFLQFETISEEKLKLATFLTHLVTIGLCILWVTELNFIIHYALFEPEKVFNSKVRAIISIATILSINKYCLHRIILPVLQKIRDKPYFAPLPQNKKF